MALSRREFIGGLFVSAVATCVLADEPSGANNQKAKTAAPQPAEGLKPNLFVHVGNDGQVTIACHRSEMGQGVRSTLPVLIADELGANPSKIRIVQGDGDKRYGDQNTDGSSSVRSHYKELRKAAATARELLITAAAAQLRVPASSLTAHDDAVWHGKKSVPFAKLADAAG
jgi:isoquinoline 1-oxidoreductase beta subunit